MSDWEDWLVEWQAWTSCFVKVKVVAPPKKRTPINGDWGDRVPEFMSGEL